MGRGFGLARGLISIRIFQLLYVVLADACMIHHWLWIVHPNAAVGMLLVCYGRLPGLIDPLGRKVLHIDCTT